MQHLDDDIDLALDDPEPASPTLLSRLAVIAAGLTLAGAFIAAILGRLTLDSKALPLVITAVFILAAIATAYRYPTNRES